MRNIILFMLLPAIAFGAPLEEVIEAMDTISNTVNDDVINLARDPIASITKETDVVAETTGETGAALENRAGILSGLIGGLAEGFGGIVRGAEHAFESVLGGGMGMRPMGGMGMGGMGMGGMGMGMGMNQHHHGMGMGMMG